MGLGDVTLMAMVGAWLGWQACVLTCFLAVFIGLTHGLLQLALRRENELPFGPSLCLAAAIVVVACDSTLSRADAEVTTLSFIISATDMLLFSGITRG